jgi:hypothetical protein
MNMFIPRLGFGRDGVSLLHYTQSMGIGPDDVALRMFPRQPGTQYRRKLEQTAVDQPPSTESTAEFPMKA